MDIADPFYRRAHSLGGTRSVAVHQGPVIADMAEVPGGASRLLARDYKGKEADRLVVRIDPGVVSLVAELRENGANSVFLAEHGETQWRRRLGR